MGSMEELVLDKSGSRLWLNMYQATRNLSILHIQGNPDSGIWEILVETGIRDYFSCEIWNPRLWNPEYSPRNLDSSDYRNPESKFQ